MNPTSKSNRKWKFNLEYRKQINSLGLKVILISCETVFSSSATIHMVLNFSIAEEIGQSFCPQATTDWFLTFKNL